jgi:hypothetical protein
MVASCPNCALAARIYGVLQKRKYLMIRISQGELVGAFGKGPSICWTNSIFVSNTRSPSRLER